MSYKLIETLSEQDYLVLEDASVFKNEFVGGAIHAMMPITAAHNTIAGNLAVACHVTCSDRQSSCRAFMSSMRLRLNDGQTYYYPDVMVVCVPDNRDPMYKSQPAMLAEVLSPSTESIDRREKLIAYKQIPSLREYLIISQDQVHVEHHVRLSDEASNKHSNNSNWGLRTLGPGDSLEMLCLPLTLSMEQLYDNVVFAPPS
jgi:Uma2 family endonuclease